MQAMVSLCSLPFFFLSFSFVFLLRFSIFVDARQAQDYVYPTATLSTRWTINPIAGHFSRYGDGSIVQAILLPGRGASSPAFACGFYCNGNCNTYLFAVFIVPINSSGLIAKSSFAYPQVVWSANRNNLVQIGAALELTSEGNLVLKDADGTVAWSTNTFGKSVVGLKLTDLGNLVLFDKDNVTVWQSFDEPTDSLVPGQKLREGQRLMPSVSETNWTVDSMIAISVSGNVLSAQVETNPPQVYVKFSAGTESEKIENPYFEFLNGSLLWSVNSISRSTVINVAGTSSLQYMKLGSDGHLRVYSWESFAWVEDVDLFKVSMGDCGYPRVCGQYGICSNGQCSCPALSGGTSYFQQVNDRHPDLGCSKIVPLSCGASQHQSLLELKNIIVDT